MKYLNYKWNYLNYGLVKMVLEHIILKESDNDGFEASLEAGMIFNKVKFRYFKDNITTKYRYIRRYIAYKKYHNLVTDELLKRYKKHNMGCNKK